LIGPAELGAQLGDGVRQVGLQLLQISVGPKKKVCAILGGCFRQLICGRYEKVSSGGG